MLPHFYNSLFCHYYVPVNAYRDQYIPVCHAAGQQQNKNSATQKSPFVQHVNSEGVAAVGAKWNGATGAEKEGKNEQERGKRKNRLLAIILIKTFTSIFKYLEFYLESK